MNERDPQKSLVLLRQVGEKIRQPPVVLSLWLPFLEAIFSQERVHYLDEADLVSVEQMMDTLEQWRGEHAEVSTLSICQMLLQAYEQRKEYTKVGFLAEKLYQDLANNAQIRRFCLRTLARLNMTEDRHIELYIDQLRTSPDPGQEAEMFHVLDVFLTIDFYTSDDRLRNIKWVVQALRTLPLPSLTTLLPHLQCAQGVALLINQDDPERARTYFAQALQVNTADRLAFLGLLACEIRLLRHADVTHLLQSTLLQDVQSDPEIAAMLDVYTLFQWFNEPKGTAPFPLVANTLTRLAGFPLDRSLGEIALGTIGSAGLLAGDYGLARSQFTTLLQRRMKQSRWAYYAAWVYALVGEASLVAECLKQCGNWPGRWTIACMLFDLDPDLDPLLGSRKREI